MSPILVVMNHPNKQLMQKAIDIALQNYKQGNYAIAALVVKNDEVIAIAGETVFVDSDSTCHAEMNAMRQAMKKLHSASLKECYLYTTYEPCPMCTSAAIWAKMKGIVYGASREDINERFTWRVNIPAAEVIERSVPKLELYPEFMREVCRQLLLM